MILFSAVSAALACLLCCVFTALMVRWGGSWGLVDRPDRTRKLHERPTPVGGGLAIWMSCGLVLGGTFLVANPWGFHVRKDWFDLIIVFAGSTGITTLGLYDDRFGLRGRWKLLGQIAVAALMYFGGFQVSRISVFGETWSLGYAALPVTLLWFVGTINAINLLDGLDGMAATIGIVCSAAVAVLACLTGHLGVAFVALVFTAALLGFLPYNFPPAKIFLGDAGSMLIGLMLGAMVLRASLKGPATLLISAPLALWTLPLFDTALAILRRKLTGRSIYSPDRSHLHHRLMQRFSNNVYVLICVAVLSSITCLAALASVATGNDVISLVTIIAVLVGLVAGGWFGRSELGLLWRKSKRLIQKVVQPAPPSATAHEIVVFLQEGTKPWDAIFRQMCDLAEPAVIRSVVVEFHHVRCGERFHAMWDGPRENPELPVVDLTIPLIAEQQPIGQTKFRVWRNGKSIHDLMQVVCNQVGHLERHISELGNPVPSPAKPEAGSETDGQAPASNATREPHPPERKSARAPRRVAIPR
ncbi:MAG: MraY family glycosyltransferase [Thermogutta sp.]